MAHIKADILLLWYTCGRNSDRAGQLLHPRGTVV